MAVQFDTSTRSTAGFAASGHRLAVMPVAALAVGLAIYAHTQIAGSGSYRGWLAALDRLFDIGLVSILAAVSFGLGSKLSTTLHLNFKSRFEELSFCLMLGIGILGLYVLLLGFVGLLTPIPVFSSIAIIMVIARRELIRFVSLLGALLKTAKAQHPLISLTFLALVIVLLMRGATPPWAVDDTIYHLPATKAFVDAGRILPLYEGPHGNMPLLIHMIYAVCLMMKTDIAAKFVSVVIAVTTAFALYAFATRFLDRLTGVIAAISFIGTAMVVEVSSTVRIDVSLAGMLFLATYALIVFLQTNSRGWLYVSGLLSGFAIGIKLNALMWVGLLTALLVVELIRRARVFATIQQVCIYLFIAAVIASPWAIKNYVWFGNPVYPFFTGQVAAVQDGRVRYFNSEDEQKLDAHFDKVRLSSPERVETLRQTLVEDANKRPNRHPFRLWEYYTSPKKYFMGDDYHYPSYLFLVLPAFFFLRKPKWLTWLFVLSICFFLVIAVSSWLARFLLPIYPPLTLIAAYTIAELTRVLSTRVLGAWRIPSYAVAFAIIPSLAVSAEYIYYMRNLPFMMGATSRGEFLSWLAYYPPMEFINDRLPPNSKVMIIGAQMCYQIERPYLPDESWDATNWRRALIASDSLEGVHAEMKRQGITHILYTPTLLRYTAMMGRRGSGAVEHMSNAPDAMRQKQFEPDYISLRNWATFDAFRNQFVDQIYVDEKGYEVLKLR